MKTIINSLVLIVITPIIALGNVTMSLTSPPINSTFQAGAHINVDGQVDFGSSDPYVNFVELYVLADNADPTYGLITASCLANIYDYDDYLFGGGYKKFNSDYKVFNATKKTGDNGDVQYFVSARPFNASTGPIIANPGFPEYLYRSVPINIQ